MITNMPVPNDRVWSRFLGAALREDFLKTRSLVVSKQVGVNRVRDARRR